MAAAQDPTILPQLKRRPLLKLGCGKCNRCMRQYKLMERFETGCLFDPQPSPSTSNQPRLLLNFDINKTILIADQVQNLDTSYVINLILSECAWGRLGEGPSWVPVGRLATDKPHSDPELMTYRNYLDSFAIPYLEGSGPDIKTENQRRKKRRQQLKQKFTEEGQPGAMFRGVFYELQRKLAIPENVPEHPMFANRERRILPSFFELLLYLQRQQRHFTIVFRTFGSDLADVADELNLFCTGQHPLYPGVRMDGSDGFNDLRLKFPEHSGIFSRAGVSSKDTHVLLGAPEYLLAAKKWGLEELQQEANGGRNESLQQSEEQQLQLQQQQQQEQLGLSKPSETNVGGQKSEALQQQQSQQQQQQQQRQHQQQQGLQSIGEGQAQPQQSESYQDGELSAVTSGTQAKKLQFKEPEAADQPEEDSSLCPEASLSQKKIVWTKAGFKRQLLTGFSDIGAELDNLTLCMLNRAYAIRDYYPYWQRRNERSSAGKLHLVDPDNQDLIPIFFDDNIGYGSAHIVDVRNMQTGETIPFDEANGKYLVKAEPLNAILDEKYFIRALAECEYAVQESHAIKAKYSEMSTTQTQASSSISMQNTYQQVASEGEGFETDSPYSSTNLEDTANSKFLHVVTQGVQTGAVSSVDMTPGTATQNSFFSPKSQQGQSDLGLISGQPIGGALSSKVKRMSHVARVSLVARQRWVHAQGKVIAALRVSKMLMEYEG